MQSKKLNEIKKDIFSYSISPYKSITFINLIQNKRSGIDYFYLKTIENVCKYGIIMFVLKRL